MSVDPEIFAIFQHKVEWIPHFARVTEVRHMYLNSLFDLRIITILLCKCTRNKNIILLTLPKMKRGQDIRLPICSYVAEKPCGCLYKLTCCNAKFHSPFKCKLYL